MPNIKSTNNKNKKSFIQRLNLQSPRSRALLVFGLFAVTGGIWFGARSFADTRLYTCTASNCLNAKTLGINAFTVNDPGKNNMAVRRLKKGGMAYATYLPVYFRQYYTVCTVVKTNSGTATFSLKAVGMSRAAQIGPKNYTANTEAKAFCMGYSTNAGNTSYNGNVLMTDIKVEVTNLTSNDIQVSYVYVDKS